MGMNILSKGIVGLLSLYTISSYVSGCKIMDDSCEFDLDCPQGEVCYYSVCIPMDQTGQCSNNSDCIGETICQEGECVGVSPDSIITKSVAGIPVYSGKTDREGKAYFQDDEEEVVVEVKSQFANAIPDVNVLYFNGDGYEAFLLDHPDYAPQLEIAAHHSRHHYRLTKMPLQQVEYNSKEKERNQASAESFASWNGWDDNGCRDRAWLETHIDFGAAMVKKTTGMDGYSSLMADYLAHRIKEEMRDDQTARVRSFRPMEHGFPPTSTLMGLDLTEQNGCDETCEDECSVEGKNECFDNGWKSCGNWDDDACFEWSIITPCTDGHNCNDGRCIEGDPQCSSHVDRTCHDGNVHWKDSCGRIEEFIESCELGYCREGECTQSDPCRHLQRVCHEGNVWHQDSCGNLRRLVEECGRHSICEEGSCFGDAGYCDPCEGNWDCRDWGLCLSSGNSDHWVCVSDSRCNSDADCDETATCNDYHDVCMPRTSNVCRNNDVWSRDSCGNWLDEEMWCGDDRVCQNGACVEEESECASHTNTTCHDGDVYWQDSCGNREERLNECGEDQQCVDGACVANRPDCFPNCLLGDECIGLRDCRNYSVGDDFIDGHCISEWPGGMCVSSGCPGHVNDSCEDFGAHCCQVVNGNHRSLYCIIGCDSDNDCRLGYECKLDSDNTICPGNTCLPR